MKKIVCAAALACLIFSGEASAQEWNGMFAFSGVTRDPVSAGRGFAGVASSSPAWASFSAPSSVSLSEKKLDVQIAGQQWAPDGVKSTNFAAGVSYRFGKLGIGAGFAMNAGEKYSLVPVPGQVSGTFTPKDMQIGVSASYAFLDFLSVGVNVKYLNSKVSEYDNYEGVSADVTGTAAFGNFRVSLGVSDVGSSVKSVSGEKFRGPSSAVAGGAWSDRFGKNGLGAAVDLNAYFSGSFTAAAGVQYDYSDMVFVRAGYHYGADDAFLPSFATAGIGVKFFGVNIDAAYLFGNDFLKNTITVGLGYSF